MKRLWLVRLGRNGEQEPHAIAQSELVLGFEIGDLSQAKDREAVLAIARKSWPDLKPKSQLNFAVKQTLLKRAARRRLATDRLSPCISHKFSLAASLPQRQKSANLSSSTSVDKTLLSTPPMLALCTRLITVIAVACAIGSAATFAQVSPQARASALVSQARAIAAQDSLKAMEFLKEAIAYDPSLAEAWLLLGEHLLKTEKYGEAAWALDYLIGMRSDDAYAHWLSGVAHYALEDHALAKQRLRRCEELFRAKSDPRVPKDKVFYLQGRLFYKEDLLVASAYFKWAIDENPNQWAYHFFLGAAHLGQAGPKICCPLEDAVKAFRRANELQPNDSSILFGLGWALYEIEAARVENDRIPDPFTGRLPTNSGHSFAEASTVAGQLIALDPQLSWNHVLLGLIYGEEGKSAEAINEFRSAIQLDPHNVVARYHLALRLLEIATAEAWSEAEGHLSTAAAIDPLFRYGAGSDNPAVTTLFHLFVREGRWTEADALFDWAKTVRAIGE